MFKTKLDKARKDLPAERFRDSQFCLKICSISWITTILSTAIKKKWQCSSWKTWKTCICLHSFFKENAIKNEKLRRNRLLCIKHWKPPFNSIIWSAHINCLINGHYCKLQLVFKSQEKISNGFTSKTLFLQL